MWAHPKLLNLLEGYTSKTKDYGRNLKIRLNIKF